MAATTALVQPKTRQFEFLLRLKQSFFGQPEVWMVLAAFLVRLAVVGFLYPERLNPDRDHWRFAGETGRIARSIVQGRGFSSPLHADTGPTAWMTPVYPFLLACVFKVFGIYTKASAIFMLSLDSLFSALTCIPVFLIACIQFGKRTGFWAGWTWALFPYAIFFSADFIWVTTLTTLLLSLIFLAALRLEDAPSGAYWCGFGFLCGISALTDPIVLTVAPALGLWMCYRVQRQGLRWVRSAMGAAIVFAAAVSPWFVRNYRTFHTVIPFRDNVGLELYTGNNGSTWHFAPGGFHPSDTDREWREFQQVGETGYMDHKKQQALDYIAKHPGEFAWLSIRRAIYMWTSFWSFSPRYLAAEPLDPPNIFLCTTLTVLALVGLRRAFRLSLSLAAPFALAIFCFPLVYYFTHPADYFRRPMDPIFVVLAVYAVVNFRQKDTSNLDTVLREEEDLLLVS